MYTKNKILTYVGYFFLSLFFFSIAYFLPLINAQLPIGVMRVIICYMGVIQLSKMFKTHKNYETIYKIVHFPRLSYSIVGKPYLKIYFAVMLSGLILFLSIYYMLRYIPEIILNTDMNYSTKVYISITLFSIVFTTFGKTLLRFGGEMNFKSDNKKEHTELMLGIINDNNIRFGLYLVYFLILAVFSYSDLMNVKLFKEENISKAVLFSFATFIAYDRLLNNRNLIKGNLQEHWKKLKHVYDKDPKYSKENNYLRKFGDNLNKK
jgi:hypothetical protein